MRILLVEDERALSDALKTILKHNNYSVDAVYDGEDALDYYKTGIYDLVILDVMLPKKDGLSVLKEIRKDGNTIPVILLTAKSEIEDKILGLDLGADDYVTKPFEARELLARIRAAFRRKGDVKENVLIFGDLTLSRESYSLSTPRGFVKLGHKEFQIIELLMLNPNKVFSADNFMDKIWGLDSDTEMSVVWVYFSGLRKKLSEIKSKVNIKTNRNLGYSLEVKDD